MDNDFMEQITSVFLSIISGAVAVVVSNVTSHPGDLGSFPVCAA